MPFIGTGQHRLGRGGVSRTVQLCLSHPLCQYEAGPYKGQNASRGTFPQPRQPPAGRWVHASPQEEGGSKSSTMTELETAMSMIIDVFARYSGAEGSKQSLTKGELKTLMEKELPGFLQVRAHGHRALGNGMGDRVGLMGEHAEGQGAWGEKKGGCGRQKGRKGSTPRCSEEWPQG